MLSALCLIVVVAATSSASSVQRSVERLVVSTPSGLIRGVPSSDGQYTQYLGVPYAVVDETNPFGASTPHPGFTSIFEANDDSAVCPQMYGGTPYGTIQCLNMNIHVPNTVTSGSRLPVMVWIHGGSFSFGSGTKRDYSFDNLVRHDVIVIGINYRVGPYGFFCVDSPRVSGNQGLKDQLLAFKWIKENIEAFGGDSSKITPFGESAGSISLELHLFSEREKLFDQAIMMSGFFKGPGIVLKPDSSLPIQMANRLGLATENLEDAISFLSRQDTHSVLRSIPTAPGFRELALTFTPCLENEYDGVDEFLTVAPDSVSLKHAGEIPLLYGVTSHEMLIVHAVIRPEQFEEEENGYNFVLGLALNLTNNNIERDVTHYYIGDEAFSEDTIDGFVDFTSDFTFNFPMERSVRLLLSAGNRNVYNYMFSYEGELNREKIKFNITAPGAAHGDELGYLLGTTESRLEANEEDRLTIDRITTLWTNFAKYANPSPVSSELLPVVLTPMTESLHRRPYIDIDSELQIRGRPFHDRLAFWNIFYNYYGDYELLRTQDTSGNASGRAVYSTPLIILVMFKSIASFILH